MIIRSALLIVVVILFSCKKEKEKEPIPVFSEANYTITITGQWKTPEFAVPPSVHFTTFAGMVHNQNGSLWKAGTIASKGIENVAEVGNTVALFAEVDSIITSKNAFASISIPAPPPTGTSSKTVYLNSDFSRFSFVSMIAPSPDWFVGISSLDLYHNKKWITDTLINLYVYDAGTEDGDVFGYNNPATVPQQNISLLSSSKGMVLANGNPVLGSIATVRLTRQ